MIKSEWIVSSMAARNALVVASADVYQGAECMVLSTGSVFRAVRSGSGATMWAGVVTEQGDWAPTYSNLVELKSVAPDAPTTLWGSYEKCGNMVTGHLYWGVTTDGATSARSFDVTPPIDPGGSFTDAAFAMGTWERANSGYAAAFPVANELFTMYLTTSTADLVCYGNLHVRYEILGG
jgi:hypothetical protein